MNKLIHNIKKIATQNQCSVVLFNKTEEPKGNFNTNHKKQSYSLGLFFFSLADINHLSSILLQE